MWKSFKLGASLAFVGVILFVISMQVRYGGPPEIPKENIPSNISSEVREQIEKLYSNPLRRRHAASQLGEMGIKATPAVPFLVRILDDMFAGNQAIEALSRIGKPAVERLIVALNDESWEIRAHAAKILGNIGDLRSVVPLIELLNNEALLADSCSIKENAIEALGKMRDKRAVEVCIKALKGKEGACDWQVMAAEALGKIGGTESVDALLSVLNDNYYPYIRRAAVNALKKITGQDFGEDQAKWNEWWLQNKDSF